MSEPKRRRRRALQFQPQPRHKNKAGNAFAQNFDRPQSPIRAYASMTTSAAKGAVRVV
ncbi:MAG: hypothetical protein ACLQLT_02725 [Methylovirgula sp.]